MWEVRQSKFIVRSLWTWKWSVSYILNLDCTKYPQASQAAINLRLWSSHCCPCIEVWRRARSYFCQKYSWQICIPWDDCLILWCSAWFSEKEKESELFYSKCSQRWLMFICFHTICVSRCVEWRWAKMKRGRWKTVLSLRWLWKWIWTLSCVCVYT